MGEAKKRKAVDPNYGRWPKEGKGIIISPPIQLAPQFFSVRGQIDPVELRRCLLFWDKLSWPQNKTVGFGAGPEVEFLMDLKIMERPLHKVNDGDPSKMFKQMFSEEMKRREHEAPGCWAISTGQNSLAILDAESELARGAKVELYRAVPIPDRELPLESILAFKAKRRDELVAFRIAIDEFFQS